MFKSGQLIDARYALAAPIGEGSMASVWQAEDLILKRQIAIKFLALDAVADPQPMIERFLREARVAASVQHRNVIHVADFGTQDGFPFMVMELLDGETLRDRLLRAPPMAHHRIVHVVSLTLRGLAAIHDAGVIHRDLKPENIFLQSDAHSVFPKIIDFGVALGYGPGNEGLSVLPHQAGLIAGTPQYMSPEQARGEADLDPSSDLYSVGVILYECLAGELPFDAESVNQLLASVQNDTPMALCEIAPDVPPILAEFVERAMSKDRRERWTSARSMRAALLEAAASAWPEQQTRSISIPAPALGRTVESLYPGVAGAGASGDAAAELALSGLNSSLPASEPDIRPATAASGAARVGAHPAAQEPPIEEAPTLRAHGGVAEPPDAQAAGSSARVERRAAGRTVQGEQPRSKRLSGRGWLVTASAGFALSLALLLAVDSAQHGTLARRFAGAIGPLAETLQHMAAADVWKSMREQLLSASETLTRGWDASAGSTESAPRTAPRSSDPGTALVPAPHSLPQPDTDPHAPARFDHRKITDWFPDRSDPAAQNCQERPSDLSGQEVPTRAALRLSIPRLLGEHFEPPPEEVRACSRDDGSVRDWR
jgi:eukaryotic-like serine/threonine-protein kinase